MENEILEIIYKVDNEIQIGSSNSTVCSIIYTSFFDIFDKYTNDVSIIDDLLERIDINKYNNTILFGFLSAAKFKSDELNNYIPFLNKLKSKIIADKTQIDLNPLFYGLE